MEANPGLYGVDADYKETRPQLHVTVDQAKAADLGVTEQAIGDTLQAMMGSQKVTTFVRQGQEYDVILQAAQGERATPTDIDNLTFACAPHHKLLGQGWRTTKLTNGQTQWTPPPQLELPSTTNDYHHPERFFEEKPDQPGDT